MVTLQEWKNKLLDILDDTFYTKTEINTAANITIITNEEDIDTDGVYILFEEE